MKTKTIGIFLPAAYRGGSLNGAKNIAKMLHLGSRNANEAVNVIFSCIENEYNIADEFSDLIELGIPVRETRWKIVSKKQVEKITYKTPLKHPEYALPCFGNSHFDDCDTWLVISDRLKRPLAPLKPYGVVIYDYIQRYVPHIFNDTFSDVHFIATARSAHFILTTTPATRLDAIQYAGVASDRVFLSPMEFDPYDFPSQTNTHETDYFLWPTNATQHKNHIRAIHALNSYYEQYDGKLAVIMTGQHTDSFLKKKADAYSGEVRRLIDQYPAVKKNLAIRGNVALLDYVAILQSATFLWHPALIDNGTYAVIEAAFQGVPSLSSDYPQMRYINDRFKLALDFCKAGEPDEMAKQLKYMEENHERKRQLLPEKTFLDPFSYKNTAPEFWQLARGLL
ncbi:MAG TPA: glycosyltransferase [Gammaproteobacteria bacterium]|nr:glycosyltransferase [Gammaproteobacteria bacterium]